MFFVSTFNLKQSNNPQARQFSHVLLSRELDPIAGVDVIAQLLVID